MTEAVPRPGSDTRSRPPGDRGRALLVLTRDPAGEMSGRKTVLATIARSIEALGFAVDVVVLAKSAPASRWFDRPVHHVRLPALPRVAMSAGRVLRTRRGSLNEALFDSPRVRREVAAVAARVRPTVVIADTLRTAGPASAAGVPVVVHLDDLLSERYRELADAQAGEDLLGFFGNQIPSLLRKPATVLAQRLLRTEAELVARRELDVVRGADAVAVTSPVEGVELERRTGRPVPALPMAVDVRPAADVAAASANSFVFLGLMSYGPNSEAIRWWRDAVRPELDRQGGKDVVLTVVGGCTEEHRRELADRRIRFTGYVDDLPSELRRHRGFVAPVCSGTGLKTKVLDAFSVGLPVVATPLGVSGLPVADGRDALVTADPAAFAAHVLRLRNDPALAARIGAGGRDLLAATWSSDALVEGWGSLLSFLDSAARSR